MKAVVIHAKGGPDQLVLADMPDPVPGPGEVVIDVAYAGCNWADTQVRMGIYPHPMTYPHGAGLRGLGHGRSPRPGRHQREGRRPGRDLPREGRRLCREMRRRRRRPDQAARRRAARCRRGVPDHGADRLSHALHHPWPAEARQHRAGQRDRRRRRPRCHPARRPCRRQGDRHDRHRRQGEAAARVRRRQGSSTMRPRISRRRCSTSPAAKASISRSIPTAPRCSTAFSAWSARSATSSASARPKASRSRTSASASCRARRPSPACISAMSTRARPNGMRASRIA